MSSHNKNFTNTVEQRDSNVNLSQNNNRNINSSNSNNDTYEIAYNEGDNVTFVCVADVGRPQGRFIWQILISAEITRNFTNVSTDTRPKLCSYEGNSTLTIQVTGADNQAIVRCFIETDVSTVTMYADSTPLLIYCKYNSILDLKINEKCIVFVLYLLCLYHVSQFYIFQFFKYIYYEHDVAEL